MGRRSTKENKTIWQITREELGLTREKAGELIPGFSPERIEKIENGRTQIQPEDALLLAKILKEEYGRETTLITFIGSVIGAHSGPGTLALFFRGKVR